MLAGSDALRLPDSKTMVPNFLPANTLWEGSKYVHHVAPDSIMYDALAATVLEQYTQAMRSCGWSRGQGFLFPEVRVAGYLSQANCTGATTPGAISARLQKNVQAGEEEVRNAFFQGASSGR